MSTPLSLHSAARSGQDTTTGHAAVAGKGWRWYWNRLRLMSPAEVLYRARQTVAKRLAERRAQRPEAVPVPSLDRLGRAWCKGWPTLAAPQRAAVLGAADEVLAGRWNVFALRGAALGFPPQWNVDPLTGTAAPMGYGKRINYRDERRVGNIKYLWEPSRHLELTTLAQAWHLSGDRRYLDACGVLLDSWLEQCPCPLGVHWASSLELAVRLLNWSVSWHLLGGRDSPLFEGEQGQRLQARWLESVWRHARFIEGFLSFHSSANNHLLGEYMGLFVAGVTWPCWPAAERWRATGRNGFEREALRQNAPDGVNREQAVYYHHEVADMMLWCGLIGGANGEAFSAAYWERLERMLGFLAAVQDAGGHVPMIGDADDALMVRLDPSPAFDPYASLLATGRCLFHGEDPAETGDAKTQWLLGQEVPRLAARAAPARDFPEGGYWVLGGGDCPTQMVCDAGPLGYLSIAAHGHADALAFTLSHQGDEVLIDPGTYAYHTEPKWRDYFRGTAAHNTLRVDGLDQSEIGGAFMWLRKANARCTAIDRSPGLERWRAEHDGYCRLADRVMHRRTVTLDRSSGSVTVEDEVEARQAHELELHWHFAEHCELRPAGEAAFEILVKGVPRLRLVCEAAASLSLHRGEEHPPLGWISRRFDVREPIWTLRVAARAGGSVRWVTRFEPLARREEAGA